MVLGVESVPDGLAAGLLAGVNPIFGLYAYLVGTVAGAVATSSAFMSVQATGAMSVIVADVPQTQSGPNVGGALAMLAVMTGAVMLTLGLLRLGWLVRFVPNSVLTGFINAVAVNIVLGQLDNLTGYDNQGANRIRSAAWTRCCTWGRGRGRRWRWGWPPSASSWSWSARRSARSASSSRWSSRPRWRRCCRWTRSRPSVTSPRCRGRCRTRPGRTSA